MKVAIYCRLSDEDRDKLFEHDDSASIQNQKAMLIKHASSNGWVLHDIYSDDDYAGSDRRRPEFNRLIVDATARKFDIVLCKSQSRFTREMELVEKYIHGLFPRLGIRFISLVDNADTDNKGNKKARQVGGLVNEWFLEELSDNIRAVLTTRREHGLHIGSFAPYGYMKDPDHKGHLIIDPEAAVIVREIFSLYLQGKGKETIAKILNEREIPNPTEYKRLHGFNTNRAGKSSTLWSYFSVTNILTNEVYIGNMVQGKSGVISYKIQEKVTFPEEQWIVVKGTHEPIIDQNTWAKAQKRAVKKATQPRSEPEGVFARKVRCIYCGGAMHSTKNGQKRGFKCRTHAVSKDACIGAHMSLPKLERIVIAQLRALADELLDREQLEAGIDPFPELREQQTKLEAGILEMQRTIDNSQTAMRTLYLDKVKKTITADEYTAQLAQLSEEKETCEKKMMEYADQLGQIERTLTLYQARKLVADEYVDTRHLTKEMVNVLIDHILIGKRDPVTKYTPVEIHWNF